MCQIKIMLFIKYAAVCSVYVIHSFYPEPEAEEKDRPLGIPKLTESDQRPSAQGIGGSSICLFIIVGVLLVLLDVRFPEPKKPKKSKNKKNKDNKVEPQKDEDEKSEEEQNNENEEKLQDEDGISEEDLEANRILQIA